jgi:hypothetical protein
VGWLDWQPPLLQPEPQLEQPELHELQPESQQQESQQRRRWWQAEAISGRAIPINVKANTAIFTYFMIKSSTDKSPRDSKQRLPAGFWAKHCPATRTFLPCKHGQVASERSRTSLSSRSCVTFNG